MEQMKKHKKAIVVALALLAAPACATFQPAKTVDDVAILLCDLHVADNQEKLAEAAEVFCDNEENLKKFAAKAAAILKAARE